MDITKETPKRILYLMRLGHPKEKGEPYSRWDLVDEVKRRGLSLLKGLKWNIKLNGVWKNRFTACEEKFIDLLNKNKPNERNEELLHELPYIIESWTPIEFWVVDDCFDKYNPKTKLSGWVK